MEKRLNIVFLSFYSGYIDRGMETVVDALARRLCKNNQVTVLQAGTVVEKPYHVQQIPISLRWPQMSETGLGRRYMLDYYYRKIAIFTLRAYPIVSNLKPDIIISTNGGWMSLLCKLYATISNSKLVISGQAGLGRDDRWNLLCKPDLFVALSQRNMEWAQKHSNNTNIVKIVNGADLNAFTLDRNKYRINLKQPIACCVAGPEPYKRVKATIHAVAMCQHLSLLLVGGSDTDEKLGSQILGNRFRRIKVNHEVMPSVYRASDLFTLVSESTEAFGVSYVEAMACGLPIVATDDELRHEIIGQAGLYIQDPANSRAYARLLEKALQTDWSDIPRKQAEKFDWDEIAGLYEREMQKLVQ